MTLKSSSLTLTLVCALALCGACGSGSDKSNQSNRAGANASNSTTTANAPAGNLDEEIGRLEKQAERNPNDDAVREALARAYVSRGNALRAANDLKGALKDYRRAIIYDEDNLEAQEKINELSLQVEGEKTGEYGEPAPPPISPGVTTEEDDSPTPASPTPTPKKKP